MDECIQYGLTKLNYSNIRHNQKEVVLQYTQGSDVLFCSPTGSGKSLTFEIAPYVLSFLRRTELLQELCVSVKYDDERYSENIVNNLVHTNKHVMLLPDK